MTNLVLGIFILYIGFVIHEMQIVFKKDAQLTLLEQLVIAGIRLIFVFLHIVLAAYFINKYLIGLIK